MLRAVNAYGEVHLAESGKPSPDTAVFAALRDELYPELLLAGMHTWEGMRPAFRGVATTTEAPCVAVYDLERAFELFAEVTIQTLEDPALSSDALKELFMKNVVGIQLGPTTPLFCYHDDA